MSQQKVDKYKQDKANRQKIMKKEKMMQRIEMTVIALVCVVLIGWVGYSIYDKVTAPEEGVVETVTFDASALQDYISGLTAEAE